MEKLSYLVDELHLGNEKSIKKVLEPQGFKISIYFIS